MVLETNILLGAFTSHDQHSDMRMDIDSMSYEVFFLLCLFGPGKNFVSLFLNIFI